MCPGRGAGGLGSWHSGCIYDHPGSTICRESGGSSRGLAELGTQAAAAGPSTDPPGNLVFLQDLRTCKGMF